MTVANAGVTGTTVNRLAKLTGAPSTAVITATTDTENAVGICTAGCGTTGNATIAIIGQVTCDFDGATTAGNYVVISATTAGKCHDGGSAFPNAQAAYGRVLSTNGAGGAFVMELMTPDIAFQNAGNGKSKPGTPANSYQYNSSSVFTGGNLFQDAANDLALRNSTTAQNFYLYNSFTDASNFERLRVNAASNIFNIISESKSGGAFSNARTLQIGITNSSPTTWGLGFDTSGNVYPLIDSNQSFGLSSKLWTNGWFSQTNSTTFKFNGFGSMVDASDGVLNVRTSANIGGTFGMAAATPAQITSNQNDYQPLSGINSARSYFQRWSTDASHNITGLSFGQVSGETHLIVNVGTNNIVLINESASSTAGNRFHNSTGADITLSADQAADVIYDSTTARWRVFKRN